MPRPSVRAALTEPVPRGPSVRCTAAHTAYEDQRWRQAPIPLKKKASPRIWATASKVLAAGDNGSVFLLAYIINDKPGAECLNRVPEEVRRRRMPDL
ncbi:hypothetical protein EYF80_033285 [Liparis tanakae]|uniref:Uncharacterized protein n=1 Tax=Liparis tanakae TaxID=230148 RepID=A0A4Z2GS48_9TELE|nr:hypothetical protein EYF80_033285 [Liparis tanakae]